jgi:eukaryotic-like serine/threonine-protein kinase
MRSCPHCDLRYSDSEIFCSRDGSRLSEPDGRSTDPLIGQLVAGYTLEERLGEGGMGIVYRAHDKEGKKVALKILRAEYTQNQDILDRFYQEAKTVNSIHHKNIVEILDFGTLDRGSPYILMEHLSGADLAKILRESGPLTPKRAISVALEVAEALAAAHDAGVIHRDLKPDNVFLLERGDTVKLLDFGIAKLTRKLDPSEERARTRTGVIMGTPYYMSPEQASGKPVDGQTDVYALGIIFYEMLTGRVPFRSPDGPLHVLMQHINEPPTPPSELVPGLPPDIEQVVLSCLEKEKERRYPSIRALIEDLGRLRDGEAPRYTPPPLPRRVRRPPVALALAVALLVGLALGGTLYAAGLWPKEARGETQAPKSAPPALLAEGPKPPERPAAPPTLEAAPKTETVTVALSTTPPGAEIILDGAPTSKVTPNSLVLPKQEREVSIAFRLEGYTESVKAVSLAGDSAVDSRLAPERSKKVAASGGAKGSDPKSPQDGKTSKDDPLNTPPDTGPPDQLDPYEKEAPASQKSNKP